MTKAEMWVLISGAFTFAGAWMTVSGIALLGISLVMSAVGAPLK